MALAQVRCPDCNGLNVVKYGKQPNGEQRYSCQDPRCERTIFLLNYRAQPLAPSMRTQIIELALDGADATEISQSLKLSESDVLTIFQQLSRFSAPPVGVRPRKNQPAKVAAG
ncbi:MAG: IS1 family transposase [Magnetococcales bacterium]|nr:IS1 family transposase [Magnetococcales bacterium]